MSDYTFQLQGRQVTIPDLGEQMNQEFERLIRHHIDGSHTFDHEVFDEASHNYFSQHEGDWQAHTRYFEAFSVLWGQMMENNNHVTSPKLWETACRVAMRWEANNPGKRIHKGTPYYFWAVSCMLLNDLENGFLLMHEALEEDRRNHGDQAIGKPAQAFVTLDSENQSQFFKREVDEKAEFLNGWLETYRQSRSGGLDLSAFRQRFLQYDALRPTAFSFVYELFRLSKHRQSHPYVSGDNSFVPDWHSI